MFPTLHPPPLPLTIAPVVSATPPDGFPLLYADWAEVGCPEYLRLTTAQPHDPAAVTGLVGYFLAGPLDLRGEWGLVWHNPAGTDYLFSFDYTKSRRDDFYLALEEVDLEGALAVGTPVRTTDRAGAGTAGTRKWAGRHSLFTLQGG